MVEPAFRVRLVTDPAIAAVVGDRIYMNVRPADERRPCLVLTRVSTFFARRFGGDASTTKGRMQVDAFAESFQVMAELADKVRDRIDGFSGTVAGTRLLYCEVEDERDLPSAPLAGRATPLFARSIDVRFLYVN